MFWKTITFFFIVSAFSTLAKAQKALPEFDVVNNAGRIVVSWKSNYTKVPTSINIQRSYDSIRNFTTIGSTLNPEAIENGYLDATPPYDAMYYRIFITFEGGSYIISDSKKPIDTINLPKYNVVYAWQKDSKVAGVVGNIEFAKAEIPVKLPTVTAAPKTQVYSYPSNRIFTTKANSIVIYLPNVESKKYTAKFFDENFEPIFQLTHLNEDYLILEKVNFPKSGWYNFELYEDGILIEKNRFLVPKDSPKK